MRRIVGLLVLLVCFGFGQASGELVILKSGKTIEGVVTPRDDSNSVEILVKDGKIEVAQETIAEILTDEEAKAWKLEQERRKAEQEAVKGTVLEVVDRDQPVVQERTLKEIGAQDQRFLLEKLVNTPPEYDGNAAEFYWTVLDTSQFKVGRLSSRKGSGERRWNFNDPIYERMLKATRIKECYFYPDYLPYPTGLAPKTARFHNLFRVAEGLIAMGREQIQQGETEKGLRSLEAALIMGYHLGQFAPVINQFTIGIQTEVAAGKALAAYYLSTDNVAKYRLFNEFVDQKERELSQVRINRLDFQHKFKAGKIEALMEYARTGDNDLLRAWVMDFLVLLKLAGEQKPLRKEIENEIPIEASQAFKMVGPGDSAEIADLFREIQGGDPNQFLRGHANQLLSMHPFELSRAVKSLLE